MFRQVSNGSRGCQYHNELTTTGVEHILRFDHDGTTEANNVSDNASQCDDEADD